MLKESDLKWHEHFVNNIQDNPLSEWYCIINTGKYARKYSIVPQYPSDDGICICREKEPEYYILFESTGHKATEEDKKNFCYPYGNYDGYIFDDGTLIRVFTNIEEAKKRAYFNYRMIYGYVMSHIVDDVKKSSENHFCV